MMSLNYPHHGVIRPEGGRQSERIISTSSSMPPMTTTTTAAAAAITATGGGGIGRQQQVMSAIVAPDDDDCTSSAAAVVRSTPSPLSRGPLRKRFPSPPVTDHRDASRRCAPKKEDDNAAVHNEEGTNRTTTPPDDNSAALASYKDHSRVPLSESDAASFPFASPSAKDPPFPVKLHRILANPVFSDIIAWLPHGRSFKVLKPKAFEESVIPVFFRHCRYSSFMRQINGWGFRRVYRGEDLNSYYHERFLRGLPHLCTKMRRPSGKTKASQQQQQPSPSANNPADMSRAPVPNFAAISEKLPVPEYKSTPELEAVLRKDADLFHASAAMCEKNKAEAQRKQTTNGGISAGMAGMQGVGLGLFDGGAASALETHRQAVAAAHAQSAAAAAAAALPPPSLTSLMGRQLPIPALANSSASALPSSAQAALNRQDLGGITGALATEQLLLRERLVRQQEQEQQAALIALRQQALLRERGLLQQQQAAELAALRGGGGGGGAAAQDSLSTIQALAAQTDLLNQRAAEAARRERVAAQMLEAARARVSDAAGLGGTSSSGLAGGSGIGAETSATLAAAQRLASLPPSQGLLGGAGGAGPEAFTETEQLRQMLRASQARNDALLASAATRQF